MLYTPAEVHLRWQLECVGVPLPRKSCKRPLKMRVWKHVLRLRGIPSNDRRDIKDSAFYRKVH
jgi:hypothetical protein